MSEVAATYTSTGVASIPYCGGLPSFALASIVSTPLGVVMIPATTACVDLPPALYSHWLPSAEVSPTTGALLPDFGLATAHNNAVAVLSGYRAFVPHAAAVLYRLTLSDDTSIPATYLHLRQRAGGQMTVEARVMGRISANQWAVYAVDQTLTIATVAQNITGEVISTDVLLTAQVTDVAHLGDRLQLYAISTMPARVAQKIALSSLLYLQTRNTGQRSLRCPVEWGVQAGDTLTHPDMDDFIVDTISMTIDRTYRVMDATEVNNG